jgi:hypothetical protein
MAYNKSDDDRLEVAMNQLADSVLGLSDDAIAGESEESGADPEEEAERTRLLLRTTSQGWAVRDACVETPPNAIPRRKASSLKR